ncbi:hypothetical protein [Paracoccus sp. MKU1]|uniref:hypothetical protein n=1 Tax=Paracoccus sp. MKU1 TaxID=1745182 RepID=UPI0007192213|nr:hypothetical protein [Paracoccus sp. MKU1]KRW94269.1 hypothetical protein AQY21_20275 [Paracoccus sp. MKU1]
MDTPEDLSKTEDQSKDQTETTDLSKTSEEPQNSKILSEHGEQTMNTINPNGGQYGGPGHPGGQHPGHNGGPGNIGGQHPGMGPGAGMGHNPGPAGMYGGQTQQGNGGMGGGIGAGIGGGFGPRAPMGGHGASRGQQRRGDLSWVRTGMSGAQTSTAINQQVEQRRAEARERGYFPNRYYLRPTPGNTGQDHIGQIIILDAEPGPRYWEHALTDSRTGRKSNFEPCPKEFDNCPLCPPNGSDESYWVMLLTVLNLKGYYNRNTGQHVHPTKELLAVKVSQHQVFDRLYQNHGTLRGLQLTMIRDGNRSPSIGNLDPATPVVRHEDAAIEAYLGQNGKLTPLVSRRDGRVIDPDPRHMMKPYDYATFLHRPEADRLRRLYGGVAPMGHSQYGGGQDQGQWGHQGGQGGYYQPEAAHPPAGYGGMGPGAGMGPGHQQGGYDHGGQDHGGYGSDMTQSYQSGAFGGPGAGNGHPAHGAQTAPGQNQTSAQSPGEQSAHQGSDQGGGDIAVRSRGAPPGNQTGQSQQTDNWFQSGAGATPGQPDLDDDIPF